jgi:hypothetical protein
VGPLSPPWTLNRVVKPFGITVKKAVKKVVESLKKNLVFGIVFELNYMVQSPRRTQRVAIV